jgi:transmembrane sensor
MDSMTEPPPIAAAIVREAATRMARLWSGIASEAELAACKRWRASHPDHERAWNRLAALEGQLAAVPAPLAHGALVKPELAQAQARRKALRILGLAMATGIAAYAGTGTDAWQFALADVSTATGEQREMALPDGSRVLLNTHSAIDIDFRGSQRLLVLRAGEILVTSGHAPAWRDKPLLVQSGQGTVEALGTRFTVRQEAGQSQVAVYEGLVEIRPRLHPQQLLRLGAGQQVRFDSGQVQAAEPLEGTEPPWVRGLLVARDMRLEEVVAEIGRYRSGVLRCDPAAAELRVSGVFSLKDTDRALSNLTLGLPVEIRYRTRYWVTVAALEK